MTHATAIATDDRRSTPAAGPARSGDQEFRIDGWLVQPNRNRLVKGARDLRVRPQLIDVLSCLAAQPGRVVTREQLLSVVWSDRFVAASGVARCMAELRQALADDARNPRIIETIPKRGYRLIAPVEPVDTVPDHPRPTVAPARAPETPPRQALPVPPAPASSWRHLMAAARSLLTTSALVNLFWRS